MAEREGRAKGFTVVELLIVIATIGILASIALVLYPGYRQRANDTERKSDVQQVVAGLSAYALQKNTLIGTDSGCGKDGDGNGWLSVGPSEYPKAILTCLQEADVLGTGDFVDPTGCIKDGGSCGSNRVTAYMKATCKKGGNDITYVLAYLESEPQKTAEVDALCDAGTVEGFNSTTQKWGTAYGMNYYVSVR